MRNVTPPPPTHPAGHRHPDHVESMRIEKWEAGVKVERECPKITEFLIIEGEALDGEREYAASSMVVFWC